MDSPLNILMFPWLAHGHISPYLELAKRLSHRNFTVHLCSTAANFKSIEANISGGKEYSIRRVVLHLPEIHLPRRLHTTNGLPPEHMDGLKETLDMAAPELRRVLAELRPDLLVYDFLQPWAPLVAAEHDVPAVEFITSSATMNAYLFHFFSAAVDDFPFPEIYYREYELVHRDRLLAEDEGVRRNAFAGVRRSNGAVLIKGFREIEAKYSDYLAELLGKKVVAVGALVQEANAINGSLELINWLDKKEKRSTVFVSFGSEYFLTKEDILELAHGLELSNFNFIWVIRFPKREDNKIVLEDSLPIGFLERVKGRGLVVEGWAPQAQILEHESVGGFVSHCGCSSMMESMKFGVPIIAMPMHIDQPLNARLVELIGVGVEVVRDGRGRLEKEVVAEVIRRVVGDEGIRRSAISMREKLRLKGDEEIDEVVAVFVKLIWENKMKKRNKKSKWLAFIEILYRSIF